MVKVEYLGHSCFYIEGEKSLIIDPHQDLGYELAHKKADFCLLSHLHFDHSASQKVDFGSLIDFNNDAENNLEIEKIITFHDEFGGTRRGKNIVYKFTMDSITFCHLGDYGETDFVGLKNRIGKIDVLFVPIGGVYTIDSDCALELIKCIEPKIVVPMHYKTKSSKIEIAQIDEFIKINCYKARLVDSFFTLSSSDLPSETEVFLQREDKF